MNRQSVAHRWRFAAIAMMVATLTACDAAKFAGSASGEAEGRAASIEEKDRDPNRLWCTEHGLYEDECVICHPELAKKKALAPGERDPNRLWCTEHGVYEDECVICHPEIAKKSGLAAEPRDPNRLWCNEHGIYEDECVLCHPELKEKQPEQHTQGSANLMCNEHRVLEAECGICRPDALATMPVGKGLKVRFASNASTAKAGIATSSPSPSIAGASQEVLGQISFNRNQLAIVTSLGAGVVVDVVKDVGDAVQPGEVLATVQSRDVAEVRSEYRKVLAEAQLAKQTLAREQDLYEREISARKDLEQAQAAAAVSQSAVAESRQHLLSLGLTEAEVAEIAAGRAAASTLPVRAPFAGTVIERTAVAGTAVQPGDALFQVADLSTMWMQLSVPESLLASIKIGSAIQARFDAYPGISFDGEIQWISPTIDSNTRMLQVRVLLPNHQGLLKDGLFGRATLAGFAETPGLHVPESAVQDVDGRKVVFRKIDQDMFETRLVEIGDASDGSVVILAGLAPHDEIVTAGSHIVKSELLKARMGAGCTDE